jgi:hypothetical protein
VVAYAVRPHDEFIARGEKAQFAVIGVIDIEEVAFVGVRTGCYGEIFYIFVKMAMQAYIFLHQLRPAPRMVI